MKVEVRTILDVDWYRVEDFEFPREGDPLSIAIEQSVGEAVSDALWRSQLNGFTHEMEDQLMILADNPVIAKIVRP